MKQRYKDSLDGEEFDLVYHNDGLFAMCDLLGFSEYINNNETMEVYNTVINDLLGITKSVANVELGEILRQSEFRDKFDDEWLEGLGFSYKIISDTFLIFPNKDHSTPTQHGFFFSVIQGLLEHIFSHILNLNKDFLLRGVLMNGDYAYTEDRGIIMGKGVIEAYRYEQMQNWSGILIHSFYDFLERANNYPSNSGIHYPNLPLKNNLTATKYRQENLRFGLEPYVINWVNSYRKNYGDISEDFWVKRIDRILELNIEHKQGAIDKILNTKKFYDYVVSQTELR